MREAFPQAASQERFSGRRLAFPRNARAQPANLRIPAHVLTRSSCKVFETGFGECVRGCGRRERALLEKIAVTRRVLQDRARHGSIQLASRTSGTGGPKRRGGDVLRALWLCGYEPADLLQQLRCGGRRVGQRAGRPAVRQWRRLPSRSPCRGRPKAQCPRVENSSSVHAPLPPDCRCTVPLRRSARPARYGGPAAGSARPAAFCTSCGAAFPFRSRYCTT